MTAGLNSALVRLDGTWGDWPMKMGLFLVTLAAALCFGSIALARDAASPASNIPFVGCASDGQQGPLPAPKSPARMPKLTGLQASRLAYYESGELGVLAPRGWHCFGLYGSDGSILIVTPEKHGDDLFDLKGGLTGPAIQLTMSFSGTSGRFEVAEVEASLFPSNRKFVEGVMSEGLEPQSSFHFGPFPHDTIRRLGADVAEFETPANQVGMGTKSRLAPTGDPIRGIAMVTPENDLVTLMVRVPNSENSLAAAIIEAVRESKKSYE